MDVVLSIQKLKTSSFFLWSESNLSIVDGPLTSVTYVTFVPFLNVLSFTYLKKKKFIHKS